MFWRKKAGSEPDHRLAELERVVDLQAYVLCVVGIVAGISVGVAAVLFMQEGKVDFDHIAVSLTIFQTLFGIAAVYGFWALRSLTRDTAEEVAEEVAKKAADEVAKRVADDVAKKVADEVAKRVADEVAERVATEQVKEVAERVAIAEIREMGPSLILREVKAYMETFRGETAISDDAMSSMIAAFDRKEDKNGE